MHRRIALWMGLGVLTLTGAAAYAENAPRSEATQECIDCHSSYNPGIVADWKRSRHAATTPAEGIAMPTLERRVSAQAVPDDLAQSAVGCYECHSLNPDKHADNFEHFGYRINVVVSPNDCMTCHPVEVEQYAGSKKAHAIGNLKNNPVYHALVDDILSVRTVAGDSIVRTPPSATTENEACFGCHGTKVEVIGTRTISTDIDDITVPILSNWPNQGVGRQNPDGSLGACTSCHPRHSFSIEIARKPYTCAQCHLLPDVPAWDVYHESKHGNIFFSEGDDYNWDRVPWTVGEDFKAPTCAACHNALLVNTDGDVVAERSHDFGDRLWVRIFGLIYSHPQPKDGDTYKIVNADGLPLPTTFSGEPAHDFLLTPDEQAERRARMEGVCRSCHGPSWVEGHFTKFDSTIAETDRMVAAATTLMAGAWEDGLADKSNPFDEPLEHKWMKQWIFYANSVRYAAAMSGPDYATFKNGWWDLTRNLAELKEAIENKRRLKE